MASHSVYDQRRHNEAVCVCNGTNSQLPETLSRLRHSGQIPPLPTTPRGGSKTSFTSTHWSVRPSLRCFATLLKCCVYWTYDFRTSNESCRARNSKYLGSV